MNDSKPGFSTADERVSEVGDAGPPKGSDKKLGS